MASNLLIGSLLLFAALFIVLSLLCLPLYHWQWRRFFRSRLWVKVYWWWPIFGIMLLIANFGLAAAALTYALLVYLIAREYHHRRQASTARGDRIPTVYAGLVAICLLVLPAMFLSQTPDPAIALFTICFTSVLSDVGAFFLGNYFGNHPLPGWVNSGKAWEGVAGQLIGSVIGGLLVAILPHIAFRLWLFVSIGAASAVGDLTNSIVKRRLLIKDWGQTIPGHGGVLDRFSSLSLALVVGYIWLSIF